MDDILNGNMFHVHHGDAITHMATMPDACMDFREMNGDVLLSEFA